MQQSPSWEASSSSASKEMFGILGNPKVHCHIHKRQPAVLTLSQRISLSPTPCETLRCVVKLYDEDFLVPLPAPKVENHFVSTVRSCLLHITRSPQSRVFLTILAVTKLGMLKIASCLTSTAVYLRSLLFWDVMQPRLVFGDRYVVPKRR